VAGDVKEKLLVPATVAITQHLYAVAYILSFLKSASLEV
jgi:hypothetical protein